MQITNVGKVVYSNLITAKGFKDSVENRKYTVGIKFEGDAVEEMKQAVARFKVQDDGTLVVYFNRKESDGAPEVTLLDGSKYTNNILPKDSEVKVSYNVYEYSFNGMSGKSNKLESVKVSKLAEDKYTKKEGPSVDTSNFDAPF